MMTGQNISLWAVCGAVLATVSLLTPIAGAYQDGGEAKKPESIPMVGMGGPTTTKAEPTAAPTLSDGDIRHVYVQLFAEPTRVIDATNTIRAAYEQNNPDAINNLDPISRGIGMLKMMPSPVALSDGQPACVTRAPDAEGTIRYGVLQLGSAPGKPHAVAMVTRDGVDPLFYVDLNGDGDLTNDGTGAWPNKLDPKDRGAQFDGTYTFDVRYSRPDGGEYTSPYGLKIYWPEDYDRVYVYRAGANTGRATIAGKTVPVALIDQSNRGDYSTGFALDGGYGPSRRPSHELTLMIGDSFVNTSGSFDYKGVNFIARTSPDGTHLLLEPTPRIVKSPEVIQKETEDAARKLIEPGADFPKFAPVYANGETLDFGELVGKKVIVLDMWATWCGPCMKSMKHLGELASKLDSSKVEVIALNVLDTEKAFTKFYNVNNSKYSFTFARDPAGRGDGSVARELFGVRGIPSLFVVGLDGKIAASIVGFSGDDDHRLEEALTALGIEVPESPD